MHRADGPWILALLALTALVGCTTEAPPDTTDVVALEIFTARCDPETPLPTFHVPLGTTPSLRWDVLCVRDDGPTAWLSIKISDWDDRADDWWNVWYMDPDLREVAYGESPLPGVLDDNNPFERDAFPRVAPRELSVGSYRAEVWAVSADFVDSTIGEAKFTVVE